MTPTYLLIVDDESINHFAMKAVLDYHYGLKCDSAFSGSEALTKVVGSSYKLIFMDMNMPGMNGL